VGEPIEHGIKNEENSLIRDVYSLNIAAEVLLRMLNLRELNRL
jgi:hypothetical protein